jgi:cobalt-zinc-cadmium efflux system membrane fusion protein
MTMIRFPLPQAASAGLALLLAACSPTGQVADPDRHDEAHADDGAVTLDSGQIAAAGIAIVRPSVGGDGGTVDLPATIEADPQTMQIVAAAIGGRIVALNHELGETVARGDIVAVIESRDAAALKATVEAAGARAALARSQLAREQRLFAEKVSPEQDLIAARTAAAEADIALRLARQQLATTGGGGGALNRVGIAAPIAGQVIGRSAILGQSVAADAELFRIAKLGTLALRLSLSPADAARVRPGAAVELTAPGRTGQAHIAFVSPILDPETRQVPAIARLDNRAGLWRVGEPVNAAIALAGNGDRRAVRVPLTAIQTVANRTVVFVRTPTGFRAVPVRVGAAAGDDVVVAGLTGRERIAAANSFILKSELGKGAAGHED